MAGLGHDRDTALEMLAFMREHGIRRFAVRGLEIELPDAPKPVVAHDYDAAPVASPVKTCNCPHEEAEHDPATGQCLMGCTPQECATKRPE